MLRERVYVVILRVCRVWELEFVVAGIDWETVSRLQYTILLNRTSRLGRLEVVVFLKIMGWKLVDNVVDLLFPSLRLYRPREEARIGHWVLEGFARVEI